MSTIKNTIFNTIFNSNFIFVTIYFLVILVSTVNIFSKSIADMPFVDNRNRHSCPNIIEDTKNLSLQFKAMIKTYPLAIEKCFNDRFSLRNYALSLKNKISVKLFDNINSTDFSKEKDDWFFRTDQLYKDILTGKLQYSDVEKTNYQNFLTNKAQFFKDQSIDYISMYVPFKNSVYPEYIIKKPVIINNTTLIDTAEELSKPLEDKFNFKFFNLKPELLNQKSKERVFFTNDSHWNNDGAVLAYNKIQKYLDTNQTKNNTKLLPISKFEKTKYDHIGDIPKILKVQDVFIDYNQSKYQFNNSTVRLVDEIKNFEVSSGRKVLYKKYTNQNKSLPKLVLIGDSYTEALQPLLAESFSEVHYFKTFNDLLKTEILNIKPDLVISLHNEEYLSLIGNLEH